MDAKAFFEAWENGQELYTINSSGSTGAVKVIELDRQWMIWSAEQSGKIIQHSEDDVLLCCLPLNKVGGLMVLVRSQVWGLQVEVMEPNANPLLLETEANIASFTPYQLSNIFNDEISRNRLKGFKEVLIGGADISTALLTQIRSFDGPTVFRHSYGMSETYSHIALKRLNGPNADKGFRPFEGVEIKQDEDGTAVIYAPFCKEGLKTNDRIEWQPDGSFILKGRSDFIINTGGVKISAEEIERLIEAHLHPDSEFVISSVPDDQLGERIVLATTNVSAFKGQDWGFIKSEQPYGAPKNVYELREIPHNSGDKVDRLKIKEMLRNLT